MDATTKSKSLKAIEQKMQDLDVNSTRYHVLETAKNFKTSWIALGRALYEVWKDKLYKDWGYATFDAYTIREIGIRKQTAMKLLRSYYFLEKEEPEYLKKGLEESSEVASVPAYEAIDLLRKAKGNKTIDSGDYADLKKEIFEKGKDAGEVRKDLTSLIRQRQELAPEEAYEKRKLTTVKRFISVLKSLKQEIEISKLLPAPLIKEISNLVEKLEKQI